MHWDDIGYLLSKNRYNENSLISEIYTKNHGKVSGIIFGGTSKKIKNYLQIGNSIHVNYSSKSENRIGFFKVEILNAMSPLYFDNHRKLLCITSAMHLIKILTADSQKNLEIFKLIENFYDLLKLNDWIKDYIFWELELLKVVGYDLELINLVEKKVVGTKTHYITKSSLEKKIVPNFMIEKSSSEHDLKILLSGLKLVGDYLEKTILKPNDINHPISRLNFINTLK